MWIWLDVFDHCHEAGQTLNRIAWPDNGAYLEQDNLLVQVFDIVRDEGVSAIEAARQRKRR
jgi:hypothetical protein